MDHYYTLNKIDDAKNDIKGLIKKVDKLDIELRHKRCVQGNLHTALELLDEQWEVYWGLQKDIDEYQEELNEETGC